MTKEKHSLWTPVVAGFLKRDHQILLGLRPPHSPWSHLWEFPGGKIQVGETPPQALAREIEEELGIKAQIGTLKLAVTHSSLSPHPTETQTPSHSNPSAHASTRSSHKNLIILFYDVVSWEGEPKAIYHTQLQWTSVEALPHLDIPEANKVHLNEIMCSINYD